MPATPGTIGWRPTASTWGRASDSSAREGGWTRNIRSRSRRRSRMSIEARYHEQVRLLVALLPFLNDEPCFALKGGTAINLFVQPFPRLSVDIDLAYLPLEPRDEALHRCRQTLQRLAQAIGTQLPGVRAELQDNRRDELRILVRRGKRPSWRVVS